MLRLAAIEHNEPTITGRKAAPGRTEYKHFCQPLALDHFASIVPSPDVVSMVKSMVRVALQ